MAFRDITAEEHTMMLRVYKILPFLLLCSAVCAQPTTNTSPADPKALGPRFESLAAGISFCPPAEMKQERSELGSTEVARFSNTDWHWIIKITRLVLEKPLPLEDTKDIKTGADRTGMLTFTRQQLQAESPSAHIEREPETINVGPLAVGRFAARFNYGLETNLTQEAVIRSTDLQYYIVAMTSPAPRDAALQDDPAVVAAVTAFDASIDSVQLLDQSMIKQDQDQRLYRTRALLLNFTQEKLKKTLIKDVWLRVLRDGKDVGYTYQVQETAHDLPRKSKPDRQTGPEGVLIGTRSRMLSPKGLQIDSENWSFITYDRRIEDWSTVAFSSGGGKNMIDQTGELGVTRWREHPIIQNGIGARGQASLSEEYRLEVTKLSRNISSEPQVHDLPPYYLPRALEEMLPQLLPPRESKGYLFASWISDVNQLMYRYIDVGYEQQVNFAGKKVRAVPIKDRVGLEGPLTIHYVTLDGQYLGSVNQENGVTQVVSDQATLESLWKNANLSRPGAVDEGK